MREIERPKFYEADSMDDVVEEMNSGWDKTRINTSIVLCKNKLYFVQGRMIYDLLGSAQFIPEPDAIDTEGL